jgi:D-alanyl-D-alanine carboxypeptidase
MQTGVVFAASEPPPTQCDAVYMYDQNTGEVLYEKNADKQSLIASTTKIMTALIV